ncbi:MAG TPA: TlpA disulfide reductase family protein [Methylophilaceae bacterium]|nr:TlpA disulfide reductase family protein [Methylophilaceae bacterium]
MKLFLRLLVMLLLVSAMSYASGASQGFVLTDMAGKQHRLSDYRGKWLLVNYWATWCPPCLEEIPDLVLTYDDHKSKDLAIIGIALQYKSRKEVADFVDDMLMSYPIVLGNKSVTSQIGPDEVLPTTFIYDPEGKLVKVRRGKISRKDIEQLLAGKP